MRLLRLQDKQRKRIRDKLLDCLRSLHNDGMVHGDIGDTNLLVGPDDNIKLIDFDWARTIWRSSVSYEHQW